MSKMPDGWICFADQQGLPQPVMLPLTAATFTPADLDSFGRASAWNDDDQGELFSDLS
jgi:hypothetical protein